MRTETIEQLYTPKPNKTMNLVVFGSGSGTILESVLKQSNPAYKIQALITDRECRFQSIGKENNIPVISLPFKKGQDRIAYDTQIAQLLEDFNIDIILLAGYMRIVHTPLLNRFRNKIINVHPADLTILNDDGSRRYVGMNGVYDALIDGETSTRSCVILVDENIDTGTILVTGPKVHYDAGHPVTKEKAKQHQEKQKRFSDWPAAIAAIEMIASGRMGIGSNNVVYIDGKPNPPCGYEL